MPKISIISITHNRSKFLKEAIKSVLSQTYTNWEHIIIDDASTDNTEEMIKSFNDKRIIYKKIIKQKNLSNGRNIGINMSNAKYIAILDSDDIWNNNKLKEQVKFLDNNPDYVVVGTGTIYINNTGQETNRTIHIENDEDIRSFLLGRFPFTHSALMIRKSSLKLIGGYSLDPINTYIEDYRLVLDLGKLGKFKNIPKYLTKYRVSENQICQIHQKKQKLLNLKLTHKFKNCYPNFYKNRIRNFLSNLIYQKFNLLCLKPIIEKAKKFFKID